MVVHPSSTTLKQINIKVIIFRLCLIYMGVTQNLIFQLLLFHRLFCVSLFQQNNNYRHLLTTIVQLIAPKFKLVLYPTQPSALIFSPLTFIATLFLRIHKLALTFATVYLGLSSGLGGYYSLSTSKFLTQNDQTLLSIFLLKLA